METMRVQQALLSLLERAHQAQQAWVAGLSDAGRNAIGTPEQWSAKDDLAHVTFWQEVTVERLAVALRGEEPRMFDDFQPVNEQTFEERHTRSWEQVQSDAEQAYSTIIERVRSIDEQILTDPQRFAWLKGRPLVASILSNGFWHPLEHIARFYAAHGARERATELLERAIEQEPTLRLLPEDRTVLLYNLACYYATTGQPGKALAVLPEALRQRPDLVEWSKEDSDLDSLRNLPAFKALYEA
jgi:tetratricopeptide (TPR) repeat protein